MIARMDLGLDGRTALVPGSTSGLGLATARALAAEGCNVVIAGRRGELAEKEAAQLPSAIGVEVDLTDEGAPETLFRTAVDAFGSVDVLVVNGGGPPAGGALDVTADRLHAALQSLLVQQFRLVEAALPGMRERGWGRIVAIGSSGVQQPLPNLALSNIGRAGLAGYLKSLASAVADEGVTVNMVLPGRIDTDRVTALDANNAERSGRTPEEVRRASEQSIPAGRYGTPEEFAAAVVFLASAPASYITGEQLRVDGGLVSGY